MNGANYAIGRDPAATCVVHAVVTVVEIAVDD